MVDAPVNGPDCRSTRGETKQQTDPIPIRLNELKRRLPPFCNDSLQKNGNFAAEKPLEEQPSIRHLGLRKACPAQAFRPKPFNNRHLVSLVFIFFLVFLALIFYGFDLIGLSFIVPFRRLVWHGWHKPVQSKQVHRENISLLLSSF
jgi:hypothetical protein